MTNIHSLHRPSADTRADALTPILSRADHLKLRDHLRNCEVARQPFLSHVLRHKIRSCGTSAAVVRDDIVVGGSTVRYAIGSDPAQTGLLVHRARTDAASGVVPVSSLLGATLIGMRVGQRAPLLCEDGTILTVTVLGVSHPA